MELRESTRAILDSSAPSILLRLADQYITSFISMPDSFVLPREHVILRPIIEVFSNDLAGFVEYIKAIRNRLSGVEKAEVHELYRTINTRLVQQTRRSRADKAVRATERMIGRSLDVDEKPRLIKKLEQHWGARRVRTLESARRDMGGSVPVDTRAALLKEFWDQIDREIEEGDLPMFKF